MLGRGRRWDDVQTDGGVGGSEVRSRDEEAGRVLADVCLQTSGRREVADVGARWRLALAVDGAVGWWLGREEQLRARGRRGGLDVGRVSGEGNAVAAVETMAVEAWLRRRKGAMGFM